MKAHWSDDLRFVAREGNAAASDIISELELAGLSQLVRAPSHDTAFLDLIWVNDPLLFPNMQLGPPLAASDHSSITFQFTVAKAYSPPLQRTFFSLKCANRTYLADLFRLAPWDIFLDPPDLASVDIDAVWTDFLDFFWAAMRAAVPQRTIACKHKRAPWISSQVINLCHKKRSLYKRMCASNNLELREKYRRVSNSIRLLTRSNYRTHLSSLFDNRVFKPKAFWSIVSMKARIAPPKSFFNGASSFCTPQAIADAFAASFQVISNDAAAPLNYGSNLLTGHYQLTTAAEVARLIRGLPNNVASGPDNISVAMLMLAPDEIALPLSKLFNLSFSLGILPSEWKLSHVIPLFKRSGSKNNISNYRPISLLSVVSKLMEKIVYAQLLKFASSNSIIPDSQFGFRPGHSCTSLGVQAFHDWSRSLDQRRPVDVHVIFLDWSKAFDSVSHSILLSKLFNLGFPPHFIRWVQNYLSNRFQLVCFLGAKSRPMPVNIGVPQGALLSGLLFNIFTADLPLVLKNASIRSYADDTFIYLPVKSQADSLLLQADLSAILSWGFDNQLSLNVKKCVLLIISRKRMPVVSCYYLSNHVLDRVLSHKSLGVIYQSNLKWSLHIEFMCAKARRVNALILRTARKSHVSVSFYKALTLPLLEFSAPVWNPFLVKDISRIESVQRRFTRIALGLGASRRNENEPSYSSRLLTLNLTSLVIRRNVAVLRLLFKFIKSLNSINLASYCTFNARRGSLLLLIPFARCDALFNSFFVASARAWNALSDECRNAESFNSFKNLLNKVLTA